jgi:hypothetical protein
MITLTGDVVGFAGAAVLVDIAEPSEPIPTPVPPDFTNVAYVFGSFETKRHTETCFSKLLSHVTLYNICVTGNNIPTPIHNEIKKISINKERKMSIILHDYII